MMKRGRIGPGRERNGRRIETDGDVVLLGLQGVGAGVEVVVGAGDGGAAAALGASVTGVEVEVEQRGVEVEQR